MSSAVQAVTRSDAARTGAADVAVKTAAAANTGRTAAQARSPERAARFLISSPSGHRQHESSLARRCGRLDNTDNQRCIAREIECITLNPLDTDDRSSSPEGAIRTD